MQQINLLDLPTVWGFRTVELWQGDICQPPEQIDALVVSAIAGDYQPTPTSVIGALHKAHNIDVGALARRPSLRLDALCSWMTFTGAEAPFGGIICVDVPFQASSISDVLQNAFIALTVAERKFGPIRTVALPLLSTGDHGLPAQDVVPCLMRETITFLERATAVEKGRCHVVERRHDELPTGPC